MKKYINDVGTTFTKVNDSWIAMNKNFEHPIILTHSPKDNNKPYCDYWKLIKQYKRTDVDKCSTSDEYLFICIENPSLLYRLLNFNKYFITFNELSSIISVQNYESFMLNSGSYDDDNEDIQNNTIWGEKTSTIKNGMNKTLLKLTKGYWRDLNKKVIVINTSSLIN